MLKLKLGQKKKPQEGQEGRGKSNSLCPSSRIGNNGIDSFGGKTLKVQDYGFDCLTLTRLPLALWHRHCTIKHEQGWRAGVQNHERLIQAQIFNYTLYFWFAKRNFPGVLTTLGFAKPSARSSMNSFLMYYLAQIWQLPLHSPCPRGTEHTFCQ